MRELELKFQVPQSARTALRQELNRRGAKSTRLIAHYFDTPDGLLARHGISLRLRKEGRRWFQTLKASGASAVDRLEHNVALNVVAGARPVLDLARHDGTPPGEILRETLQDVPAETLMERFATDVQRLAVRLQWPHSEVEAALDAGHLRAGERDAPILELELEHLGGGLDELFELARLWQARGEFWLDTRSKSRRGAVLADRLMFGPEIKARAPLLDHDMSGHDLLRTVVNRVLEQILGNASEVAAGSSQAEHVHQLRVGLRRLRTALREMGTLAQGIDPGWEPALAHTFGQLGAIRDDEAVAAAVHDLLRQAGAPKLCWPVQTAVTNAAAIVREPQFQRTLIKMLEWAATPADPGAAAACPPDQARQQLVNRLGTLHKRVLKGSRDFAQLPTDDQHGVRKRLKRLRYLAEFVSSLWPEKATRRYLKRLGPAQDALGRHHDAVVAAEKFLADAQHDPLSYFAAGYLSAHRIGTAQDAGAALIDGMNAKRFWKR